MGDDESTQPKDRQPKQNKIIIRKLKKPPVQPKSKDSKKVNGELSAAEIRNQEIDNDIAEIKGLTPKEVTTKVSEKVRKRKLSAVSEDDDVVIIEEKQDTGEGEGNLLEGKVRSSKRRRLLLKGNSKNSNTNKGKETKDDSNVKPSEEPETTQKAQGKQKVIKLSKKKKKSVTNGKKGNEGDSDDPQSESQAEYAQYLGLQPTMQFKCYRCGEKGFPSMLALNMHQRLCEISQKSNFLANLQQDTMTSSDPNMLTNFRITRKVYLCSACGTYYENWNLFLHMREVHKKHICLYCLTMFGIADKLADHLKITHKVVESSYKSSGDFQNIYKGSCYLICCNCENMFSERDDFFNHQCITRDPTAKCTLCGVKCGHYYTCPNSNQSRPLPAVTNVTQSASATKSQASAGLAKFVMPSSSNKGSEELWMGKKDTSFHDDDYDISHAASFCHVDIVDESAEKDKARSRDNSVEILTDVNKETSSESSLKEKSKSFELVKQNKDSSDSNNTDVEQLEKESVHPKEDDPTSVSSDNVESIERSEKLRESHHDPIEKLEFSSNENEIKPSIDQDSLKENPSHNEMCQEMENEFVSKTESLKTSSTQEPVVATDQPELNEKCPEVPNKNLQTADSDLNLSNSDDEQEPPHSNGSPDNSVSSSDESAKKESEVPVPAETSQEILDSSEKNSANKNESNVTAPGCDENSRNLLNFSTNDNNSTSKSKESEDYNNKSTFNEALNDFNLEDIIGVNGPSREAKTDNAEENEFTDVRQEEPLQTVPEDGILLAGVDVPAMALTLEDKLETCTSQTVVKECVRTSCLNCVYCSHAVKIAVNGKQLALHLLAEHRYKPVKNNETTEDVVKKLKSSLNDLEPLFFNTDSYDSSDKTLNAAYDYTYECFQCRFVTKVHKELCNHKRKMHQKTVMLCVMCKTTFNSYSELLCHLCPGIYASENIIFRCCFCNLDMIPSTFRLMVHLRKSHHTCDICLEVPGDQQKLSTHMWKHKLSHLCYRCGIAYRNKPDITKHLFWKHGTESVLCKKCLQKKWPHVYHFCIPPTVFMCEECNNSFTKAVALKVHKRLHSGELPYECSKCDEKFVSKKLQKKHEEGHNRPTLSEDVTFYKKVGDSKNESTDEHINVETVDEPVNESLDKESGLKENENKCYSTVETKSKKKKKKDKDKKAVLDVYDLPPLNLSSESDSSDDETNPTTPDATKDKKEEMETENTNNKSVTEKTTSTPEPLEPSEEPQAPPPVVDGVWDSFQTYKAELEKRESKDLSLPNILPSTSSSEVTEVQKPANQTEVSSVSSKEETKGDIWTYLDDHNYCFVPGKPKSTENDETSEHTEAEQMKVEISQETPAPRGHSSSIDHAYTKMNNTSNESNTIATPEKPSLEQPSPAPVASETPPTESHSSSKKKKQKTPKKKKPATHSSSSSDSSSDSDSSSCSSNCSGCNNCTGSSSSSSSSSDSDSSTTPEGRQKTDTKKESKTERSKRKHQKEGPPPPDIPPPLPPPIAEEPLMETHNEPIVLPIRESDLDTDESSTDEDFYDKYPQQHAKEQLEKRNLMLLASLAPINNGTASPLPPSPKEKSPPPSSSKRKMKVKLKRRRKSQQSKKVSNKNSTPHHQSHPKPSTSLLPTASSTPSHVVGNYHNMFSKVSSPLQTPVTGAYSDTAPGSGSENESARLSKRKRVRNKFYGYSSEEEGQEKPSIKWRKTEPTPQPYHHPPTSLNYQATYRPPASLPQARRPKPSESSGSDAEPPLRVKEESSNSSSSSDSEPEFDLKVNIPKEQTEKNDNLYCYCQCPYDEVSEMIACDGEDCTIEWFHFECVGIMVPPKGKWYCPDCRKRRDLM